MDVFLTVLAVLLGIVLIAGVATVVAVLLGMRSLRKRNRVSPDQATDAPVGWLWSPAGAARMHRRLRSAVSVARTIAARHDGDRSPSRTGDLARQLEAEAVGIDQHLTVVSRLAPAERKRLSRHLGAEVTRIEQLASRLSLLDAEASAPAALPHHPSAIDDLAQQLEQLEQARREVAAADAEAGLDARSPLPRPATAAPDPPGRRRLGGQ